MSEVIRSCHYDGLELGLETGAMAAFLRATGPLAVVDLETTGLSDDPRAQIIEFGAVLFEPSSARVRTVECLVRPDRKLPAAVQRLTGLTDEDLEGAPQIAEVARALSGVLAGRTLIAHNTDFERHFLTRFVDPALRKAEYLDTQDLLSVTHPDAPDLRLESFTRSLLGVEEQHRGLADALDTARVISHIAVAARAGEQRYRTAHRCFERFSPTSQWLALVASSTTPELEAFDAPPEPRRHSQPKATPDDPFEYVDVGDSDEQPVPFDEDAIAAALSDSARGLRHLAGYRVRQEQVELARHFARNLAHGGELLLEGGTGVGKSFAYLAAAIPFAMDPLRADGERHTPVVISTRTKLLQDQLLHKDIAAAARFLGYPKLRAISIKGRANYLCERRMKDVLAEGGQTSLLGEDRHAYAVLLACARTRPHGEVGTLPGAFFFRHPILRDLLRRSVAARAEQCSREQCAHQRECPFGRRRAALAKADLIVANHDLLLRWPPDYPKFTHVVIDEGHELAGVADEVYALHVRPQELFERVDELFPVARPRAGRASRASMGGVPQRGDPASAGWRRDLRQDLMALGRCLVERAGEYGELELPAGASELLPDAADLASIAADRLTEIASAAEADEKSRLATRALANDAMPDPSDGPSEVERAAAELRQAADALRSAFFDETEDAVASFEELERPYDRWELSIRAVSPATPFHEQFLSRLESTAIVSASLFVGGDSFAALGELELEERCGDRIVKISVQSPFPYKTHMRALALEPHAPGAASGFDLVEETALVLAATARALGGRTLGLFTSLRRMNQVAQRLSQLLRGEPIEILTPRRASDDPAALVARFARASSDAAAAGRQTPGGAVLLGARTFWQGLDIPGAALQAVVIEKLPFEVPTELRRRREDRLRSDGFDAFERFSLGKMLLYLKQMTGRLIRSEDDRGIVVIVEGRTRRPYFEKLAQALPPGVDVEAVPIEACPERLAEALESIGIGQAALPEGRPEPGEGSQVDGG